MLRHGVCFDEQMLLPEAGNRRGTTEPAPRMVVARKATKRLPTLPPPRRRRRAVKRKFATVAKESARPARSFSVRRDTARTSSDGAAGTRISLCATSTNRSLSPTLTQIPLDRCASFHRRMTNLREGEAESLFTTWNTFTRSNTAGRRFPAPGPPSARCRCPDRSGRCCAGRCSDP